MTEPTAFLAFWPREPHQWWARRYGHVTMFFHGRDTWVHVDVERRGVEIKIHYARDDVDDFLSFMLEHTLVVRIPVQLHSHFWYPMTCVSFVKHAFGIRSRALFPDGLLRSLRRQGVAEIVNENAEDQGIPGAEGRAPALAAGTPQDDPGADG